MADKDVPSSTLHRLIHTQEEADYQPTFLSSYPFNGLKALSSTRGFSALWCLLAQLKGCSLICSAILRQLHLMMRMRMRMTTSRLVPVMRKVYSANVLTIPQRTEPLSLIWSQTAHRSRYNSSIFFAKFAGEF